MDFIKIDYKILNYISRFDSVHINDIVSKFNNESEIKQRLKRLRSVGLLHQKTTEKLDYNGVAFSDTEIYCITEKGRFELSNYKHTKKEKDIALWLKNAWIPIAVSLVTNLLIDGIKLLLPLIQEWLTRAPL